MIDYIPLKIVAATGYFLYAKIPADALRNHMDKLFPYLAKCEIADCASGYAHRWRAGHDLLLDVPKTFINSSLQDAVHQTGHIIFTDFPTKAGMPIPGFSQSGLGEILHDLGISSGWLNISFFKTGLGFLCVAEGHEDLLAALSGKLEMSFETFVDTYVEGLISLSFGISSQDLFLVTAGAENLLAGIVSTYKSLEHLWTPDIFYIDPIDFFGGAIGSAIVGGLFTLLFSKEPTLNGKLIQSLKNASKSAGVGALFAIDSFLGYGALLGMIAYQLGENLAEKDTEEISRIYSIDIKSFDCFLKTVCEGDPKFIDFWESSFKCRTFDSSANLVKLNSKIPIFFENYDLIFNDSSKTFDDSNTGFDCQAKKLNDLPEIFDNPMPTFDDSKRIFDDSSNPLDETCNLNQLVNRRKK